MKLMKSSTRLDSIVFQLTPTRTRCDLVITANGKSEKIASGLLKPFLAHLKAAEEQIGKGGYSIVLEPKNGSDAAWFTKGTVERFVRFVSSPEILERVCTIESEILQIDKAISLQNSNDNGFHNVEGLPAKSEERLEGTKPAPGCNEENAIVLYQPPSNQSEEDASSVHENSKVQLVQVLETRKSVLQKEQGMAFARAVAAGFEIDSIAALLSFAECFGASRMMDACKKFLDLWKAKHESGQWVEVEAADAMSCRPDMPSTNAAGIVFLSPSELKEFKESSPQGEEKKGVSCVANTDQVHLNPHEYSPGQFPHPMYPPWQLHPQANGMPVFQPYPMQGMPYYQNYMGQSPYFQPPYSAHDDSRLHSDRKARQRRHSMDGRDTSAEFETQEIDASGKMHNDVTDEEDLTSMKPKNKGSKTSRKKTVVIRNLNYITSTKQGSSDSSDPQSSSDSGTNDEGQMKVDETKKLKKKGVCLKSDDPRKARAKEERVSGQAGDDGHWQAFQNFLLTDADEDNNSARSSVFSMEGNDQGRKRQSSIKDDSSALGMHNISENHNVDMGESVDIAGDATCLRKPMDDQMLSYGQDPNLRHNNKRDLKFMESGGRSGAHRRSMDTNLEYVLNKQEKLTAMWDPSLDPVIRNGFQGSSHTNNKGSSHGMPDESFMVLQRAGTLDQVTGDGRTAMDMDCELPSVLHKTDDHTYEPNVLNLMPNRAAEDQPNGYDPAMYCEMQAQIKDAAKLSGKKEVAMDAKGGSRKAVKDQKLKAERRTSLGTRREKPSKLSPAEDARARAEKLRAYKADLQKLKKEKEEEQMKRLEALKLERQKRIAAKSGANPAQSALPSQQAKKQMPKLSPVSQKGSKFSDTEPGSSSPLQRSTFRFRSKVSPDTSKASKSGRLNNVSSTSANRLTRSASSLRSRKEENTGATPDSKATISRIRRLSEPKVTIHRISSGKTGSAEVVARYKTPEKKMPATSIEDKEKSSARPELKVRTSKASTVTVQRKPTKEMSQRSNDKTHSSGLQIAKEMSQKSNDKTHSSGLASAKVNRDSAKIPLHRDDDSTVVEKTVVMLECEKPSAPISHAPEDDMSGQVMQSHAYDQAVKPEEDAAVPLPASPINVIEVDRETSNCAVKEQSHTCLDETEKVSQDLSQVATHKKPYQPPYARVSSLEDPCMSESVYGKAPPTSIEMEATAMQTTKVHVSDAHKPGLVMSEADSGKSSKGFKRLLMFGKKNSTASERNIESDKVTLDGSEADDSALNGSSSEAFTVKNLLIQEESSSAGTTPKKSSRPFSLLSHFRSKNSEKKLAT
ncbi:uncharacterized protein LOC110717670 isoform X2 [Chenopodium quinoa]|uniref:COP1-interacting protein 7 n=1 Tax=Chenopodium quinoa TaxID=63459 RepID=A0A803KSZ6_CHEQI|nr:uncharacterized protein LOC110717670 isoform X2 [Chenopodium quinoa]